MKLLPLLASLLVFPVFAAPDPFADLPESANPKIVGQRVVENYLERFVMRNRRTGSVIYPEACAGYGALTATRLAGQTDLNKRVIERYSTIIAKPIDESQLALEPLPTPPMTKGPRPTPTEAPTIEPRVPTEAHVDFRVFGIVPLEIHQQTKDSRALQVGRLLADAQWINPGSDGITREARYWVDDMYMITAVQVQAFRATGEQRYLDRAATTVVSYLDKLQQPNGLFLHASDSPFYWGRGNGWFAAGMTELLSTLPTSHPQHARILAGYRLMMASLLKFQSEGGLWRQLVDKPASWPESSGSAMFTFAMVTGVKRGWLDAASYGPAARKAWIALVGCLDDKANLREVCVGTNKGMAVVGPDLAEQEAFYMARQRQAGDFHGQAPMLWTVSALLR